MPWYWFPRHEIGVGVRFTIEGKLYHMVLFSPREALPWDFFREKVCHMVFLQGKRLPYGIISGGGGG